MTKEGLKDRRLMAELSGGMGQGREGRERKVLSPELAGWRGRTGDRRVCGCRRWLVAFCSVGDFI